MIIGAVLVLGFANLIADGISMGLSDFVSSSTERDLTFASRKATIWRMGKDPHSQILDLVDTYKAQGMSEEDALMVYMHLFISLHKSFFYNVMHPEKKLPRGLGSFSQKVSTFHYVPRFPCLG